MLRDPDIKSEDGYVIRPLIMESAKELTEWSKCLPDTKDLPTSHEYFVETVTDAQSRTIKRVGVRRRIDPATKQPPVETDGLNAMGDGELETVAARAGIIVDAAWRKLSKAKKVEGIRAKAPRGGE